MNKNLQQINTDCKKAGEIKEELCEVFFKAQENFNKKLAKFQKGWNEFLSSDISDKNWEEAVKTKAICTKHMIAYSKAQDIYENLGDLLKQAC